MNKKQRELFEKREALQFLFEHGELRCLELRVKLKKYARFLNITGNYQGIRSEKDASVLLDHLFSLFYKQHIAQIEYVQEKTNLSCLKFKVRELWP